MTPSRRRLPNWKGLADQPIGTVLASIPDISTFNSLISGQANPAVNIVPVLDNGPYVVFAPTNEAFAAMEPGQLDAIKADPAALTKLDYYHVFLGLLGPDDVHGQRPTQQGAEIKVTGKGGDIKVNDTAKVVCGGDSGQQRADLHHRHGAGPGERRRSRSPRRGPRPRRRPRRPRRPLRRTAPAGAAAAEAPDAEHDACTRTR